MIECAEDCKLQHGADSGYCGNVTAGDHNCYCDGRSGSKFCIKKITENFSSTNGMVWCGSCLENCMTGQQGNSFLLQGGKVKSTELISL